jgi:hypothetical protein
MINRIIYGAKPTPGPCDDKLETANKALAEYKSAKERHELSKATTKEKNDKMDNLLEKLGQKEVEPYSGIYAEYEDLRAKRTAKEVEAYNLRSELNNYFPFCNIPWFCSSLQTKIDICNILIKSYQDKLDKYTDSKDTKGLISILISKIIEADNEYLGAKNRENQDEQSMNNLESIFKKLNEYYGDCKILNPSLHLHAKLNSSCKEINQKMKTIKQKIENINFKSIDLKYGAGTLDSLKIEKSLSDSKVTIIKNLLKKLDEMKPSVPQEFYLSFLNVYNEAKTNLNSYESEKKMFQAKIKNASKKRKNILINLPKLKNSLSKIIKKLVNCENPLIS